MSELTAKQLRAAAAASRQLAMECVTGEAPPLIPGVLHRDGFYCVAGLLGFRVDGDIYSVVDRVPVANAHLRDLVNELIEANNTASDEDRHGAVVFPLLALADAMDLAAEGRPQKGPSNDERS